MKKLIIGFLCCISAVVISCDKKKSKEKVASVSEKASGDEFPNKELSLALEQYELLLEEAIEKNKIPRTTNLEGGIHWVNEGFDWTKGFFPGSCWYLYEFTKDDKWSKAADYFQSKFSGFKNSTSSHDLGFVFNNSYGNGYRLTKNEDYKETLVTAATSLIERFNPKVGALMSWDVDSGWQAERGWKFPVIIDNMMNLEMLFEASIITGDNKFKDIAVTHANTTLKNHFRADFSSYHVVDYDPEIGEVRSKQTAQGYAHESSWARGQAWALYGFVMSYRYTKNEEYLRLAENIANFILNHRSTPEDMIPYWDYEAPNIPDEPRDASAAAITASALIEISAYSDKYSIDTAKRLLQSLASSDYTAKIGENNYFILAHSVGSIPHGAEIDVPLSYADYYYIEAMLRYKATLDQ